MLTALSAELFSFLSTIVFKFLLALMALLVIVFSIMLSYLYQTIL